MYVQKKQMTVWDCGLGHNHRTEEAAVTCLYKVSVPRRRVQAIELRKKRNTRMAISFLQGYTYQEIADAEGLSKTQTKYLVERMLSRAQYRITGDFHAGKTPTELRENSTYWIEQIKGFY